MKWKIKEFTLVNFALNIPPVPLDLSKKIELVTSTMVGFQSDPKAHWNMPKNLTSKIRRRLSYMAENRPSTTHLSNSKQILRALHICQARSSTYSFMNVNRQHDIVWASHALAFRSNVRWQNLNRGTHSSQLGYSHDLRQKSENILIRQASRPLTAVAKPSV